MKMRTAFWAMLIVFVSFVVSTDSFGQSKSEVVKSKNVKVMSVMPEVQTAQWAQSWWQKRHDAKIEEKDSMDRVDLLMVGDSITHSWENDGKAIWNEYYANRHALNIGFSGDRTEQVVWRIQNGAIDGISPKLAVIMIGTNNAGHRAEKSVYTAAGVRMIIDELQLRLPETKILLLGIFPRGANREDKLRKLNVSTNQIISQFADGENIHFLDISDQFLDSKGNLPKSIMPDLLHPNAKGYEIWAKAMESKIVELMGE